MQRNYILGKHYVPAFHFDLAKPCYCRSGKLFGDCCAQSERQGDRPHDIQVFNHFLSDSECNRFIRFAEKQKRDWLKVVDSEKSVGNKRVYKKHPSRITQIVQLGNKQNLVNNWIQTACEQKLALYAGMKPQWFEPPQLLRYGPGGKYGMHADADHFCQETKQFYRFIDRDFSMLIYLNDDYEGGGLYFRGLNYHYQPKQGDLVIFPSNHIFSHESVPIVRGKKYALVSWGAFPGTARVASPRSVVKI